MGTIAAYRLRTALEADAAQITRLSHELGYPVSESELQLRLKALLASTRDLVLVAADADLRLLGWISVASRLALEVSPRAEITGLVVGAAARRAGIGRALVGAGEAWAAQQGFEMIAVRSNVLRSESHPFYRNLGYRQRKTQHYYEKTLARASGG
ncbi:MAG: GNAT family N-acetyltransferase [Steroidobacteraceae bacterium]